MPRFAAITQSSRRGALLVFGAALVSAGCQPAAPSAPVPAQHSAPPATTTPAESTAAAMPKADFGPRFAKLGEHLAARDIDQAESVLRDLQSHRDDLDDGEKTRLAKLQSQAEDLRTELKTALRAAQLQQAEALISAGNLDGGVAALDEVQTLVPTPEERETAQQLRDRVEDLRRRRRALASSLKMLASNRPDQLRAARSRLAEEPEVAAPLLSDAIAGNNEALALAAVESLRSLKEPARTLPILAAVVADPRHSKLWSAAVREISRMDASGAGAPLLAALPAATDPAHRAAVLAALAEVVDPPPETVVALLPSLFADGPELVSALRAAQRAVTINRQFDLQTGRGLNVALTAEQSDQVAQLADRLESLASASAADGPAADLAREAAALGLLTRLLEPKPIGDVKVLRATAEHPDYPASGVVDGTWNSIDPKTMWLHPTSQPVTILLDLGTTRTVSGLRVWNINDPNYRTRGWKELDVFVSDTTSSLKPVAHGIIPVAPGADKSPDFSVTVPVPAVRGRYIRIESRGFWSADNLGGLSEIQVLGF